MAFGHERLDVYRAAIDYVGWAYRLCVRLKGQRGYSVNEDPSRYGAKENDSDSDTDSDPEKKSNSTALDGNKRRHPRRS